MESENRTVDEIIADVRSEIDYGEGVLLHLTGKRAKEVLQEIETAFKRESEQLKEERNRAKLKAIAELRKREVRRNFDRFATVDEARRAYELECGKTFNEHCAKCPWCPDDTTYARFVSWLFGNAAKGR